MEHFDLPMSAVTIIKDEAVNAMSIGLLFVVHLKLHHLK
jgi:hypothetical protein